MRLRTRGMFLVEGERKFFLRGVSYGPFRPNAQGEPFPDKAVVEADFERLRELGANGVRCYHVPPPWLVELSAEFDLRLLVGVPWSQHIRFLDDRADRAAIRRSVREAAASLRDAPHLLGLLIGNEIPPPIIRWYGRARIERFLAELADEARQVDPQALVSYANFPTSEYLELGFLDFSCFNLYLHRDEDLRRYLPRLQNLADFRPLVLSEFGMDSRREGEAAQAGFLAHTIATAAKLGCAGSVVFSFTDEWHTGGHDVEDWAFGLVTADRQPKPACEAVRRVYTAPLPPLPDPAPRVSVVVCAYDAERTLAECLDSLRQLRYPDFEVVVIDDGSTDRTREIASGYDGFRVISQANRGLSAARNAGIQAASGSIVAFTDADCAVDPDWLTFLVHRLLSGDLAGVGGPNLPPAEEHWVAQCVARAPGGPTHVLVTDWEAEHIPGCNMAFWRDRLLAVGMFDPAFRVAGDDVDLCWRLQNSGEKLGFAAAALVWHRRRNSVSAYLRQQRGYGQAEALLYVKHPFRFDRLGHSRWLGRIYSDLGPGILSRRPVVYSGPLGSGLFQTLYEPPASLLRYLPATLEWHAVALGLVAAGLALLALGLPHRLVTAAGVGLLLVSLAQAGAAAARADVADLPPLRARLLVALLHYVGPLWRSVARHRRRIRSFSQVEGISVPAPSQRPELDLRRRRFVLGYWNETGIGKEACLAALVAFLRPRKYLTVIDDGWQPWDLVVHRGLWVRAEVDVLVENHGASRRLVAAGVSLRQTALAKLVIAAYLVGAALAASAGAWPLVGVLAAVAILTEGFYVFQGLRLGRTLYRAIDIAFKPLRLDAIRR
jgi:glycosyltransferase involved in cell wall biosynthesis